MAGPQEPFGELLRRYREAAGYSQEQLAARARLSANAVGALERGERKRPYPDTLRRLADALELGEESRASLSATVRHGSAEPRPVPTAAPGWNPEPALPGEPTPIIGRDRDLEVLCDLLAAPGIRALTLVGPGGVGKTRLALSLARRVADTYADGAVWVELAPLADHTLVLPTVGRAVGLPDAGGTDIATSLRSALGDRRVLIVLDNMEHLLGAVPDLAQLLLACPGLQVVTTSRAPLRLRGEQEYQVVPLEVPPAEPAADEPAAFPAVRLFVARAREKDPSFALEGQEDAAVAAICRRLGGLPLALELVAARTRALTPTELVARLDDPLTLLVGGSRDLPERQQTMRAAIAWSDELLDPAGRAMFRRLAAFSGGWTLQAAEAVCGEGIEHPGAVLDLLDVLVEQSLVSAHRTAQGTRYQMLEPIRQYARERLEDTGEATSLGLRHAQHFCDVAESAALGLEGRAEQARWVDRLHQELDNLRGALGWCEQTPGEEAAEMLLRSSAALWRFWEMRWHVDEGRRWLSAGLARPEPVPPAVRAAALNAAGNLARDQDDHDQAAAFHEQALAIRRSLGDVRGIGSSLNNLGVLARDRGDAERTLELCLEALALFREAGDEHRAAIALISLGNAATRKGDMARARDFYGESLGHFREEEDRWHTGWVLTYLAEVMVFDGDLGSAQPLAEEALQIFRTGGDPWGAGSALGVLGRIEEGHGNLPGAAARFAEALRHLAAGGVDRAAPACLADLAAVLLAMGDTEAAARLAGGSRAWQTRVGRPRAPLPQADRSVVLEGLAVGPHAAAWQSGAALSREHLLREAAAYCD